MAQHDYVIANGTGAAVRSDLNNALAAIVTNNSGSTEPTTTYAYQWWADTTTGQLKLRNAANSAWITITELDGTLLMEDGSAASPGLAFATDLDTGFFLAGANQLGIATNGTGRLFVTSDGKINIGSVARIEETGEVKAANGTESAPSFSFLNDPDNGMWRPTTNTLGFSTAGTERARIDSSGRLLVGTSSSSSGALLITQGSATNSAASSSITLARGQNNPSDGFSLGILGFSDSGHVQSAQISGVRDGGTWTSGSSQPTRLVFSTTADGASSPTERVRIDSSGRIGIGTTSPAEELHINGSTPSIRLSDTAGSDLIARITNSSGDLYLDADFGGTTGDIVFRTNSSERGRWDPSGRFLVGTSSSEPVGFDHLLQLEHGSGSRGISLIQNTADEFASHIDFAKSRSTGAGGNTIVQNGDWLGSIVWRGADGSDKATGAAYIICQVDGTPGANDMPGRLVFATTADGASSSTERMRITSAGRVAQSGNLAGSFIFSIENEGNNSNRYGLEISCGADNASGTNYAVQFYDGDGTTQGAITFTGGTVTYGAFTAHHPCILPEEDNENGYPYGTLLETVAIEYTEKDGVATERGIRYKVRKTQAANSKAVLGAYGSSMNGGPDGETNLHQALVLGDGHILCNGLGGNIKVGDGICSSAVAGIGQKATATPSMIIGIAQEDVTFDGDETKLVPVQYGLQQFIPWQD